MKWISLIGIVFSVLFFSGCGYVKPEMSFAPPKYVEELPAREEQTNFGNPGSLFNLGDSPIVSDRKAMSVNDLVTVVISENATATSSDTKALSRSDQTNLGGLSLGYNAGNNLAGTMGNIMPNINSVTNIGATINSGSDFSGSGSQQKANQFQTTVSARVIKILNNGNYYIEGSRQILIDGNKQNIRVSGVIRPEDISSTNSIDSMYIADAKILYENEGDISRSTQRKWGSEFLDVIWPF